MKKIAMALGLAWLGLAAVPAGAQTACASFRTIGNQNQVHYNPYGGPSVGLFLVEVNGRASGVRFVNFLLVDGDSTSSGGNGLGAHGPIHYQLNVVGLPSRGFGLASDQPTVLNSAVAVLPGSLPGFVLFQLTIPAGQQTRAGTHVQQLTVRYQCLTGNGTPIGMTNEQAVPLHVDAIVPSFVSASINGSDHGEINFHTVNSSSGTLTKSLDVSAVATLPYEVAVASNYGAMLRRQPNDPARIRYTMSYGEVPVAPGQRVVCSLPPVPAGSSDPFAVTLNATDLDAVPAGSYSDTVTLTFTPRDVMDPASRCALQP